MTLDLFDDELPSAFASTLFAELAFMLSHPTQGEQSIAEPRRARTLAEAVLWTVLYADVFDYPLTREEVFTYVIAPGGSRREVDQAIDCLIGAGHGIEATGGLIHRRGRANVVAIRRRRQGEAQRAWRRARRYARLIWALPYVRMVAVTGALAMDNVEAADDIDFLVVTDPGRLWLTRAMIIVLVRLARLRGDTICPNYLVSMQALRLDGEDLYTAHELAQMVLVHGRETAHRFWLENAWCARVLPNAHMRVLDGAHDDVPRPVGALKELMGAVLRLPPGNAIEGWERRRKIAKLAQQVPAHVHETLFSADVCKGHHHGHGARALEHWASSVRQITEDGHDSGIAARERRSSRSTCWSGMLKPPGAGRACR